MADDRGRGNCSVVERRDCSPLSKTIMSEKRIKMSSWKVELRRTRQTFWQRGRGPGGRRRFGKRTYWKRHKEGRTLKEEGSLRAWNGHRWCAAVKKKEQLVAAISSIDFLHSTSTLSVRLCLSLLRCPSLHQLSIPFSTFFYPSSSALKNHERKS